MGTLFQDVRYGFRMLRKNPGFALVAVLTLALGIGANSAIVTIVNAELLQPLPYPEPDRLVYLNEGNALSSIGYPNYVDWAAQNHAFENIGSTTKGASFVLTGHGDATLVPGTYIANGFLPALGVKPQMGRGILPSDDKPGATPVALISYKFWQQQLGGDANVLNSNLQLDDHNYAVVGVMPADFKFLFDQQPEVFVPIGLTANSIENQDRAKHNGVYAIARLKPGITMQQAQSDMDLISARLAKAYPNIDYEKQATVHSLYEVTVGGMRSWLMLLLAAVGLVLLIACANVANLVLVRVEGRRQELAIRSALGARWSRIASELLVESLVLGLLGSLIGLGLAYGGLRILLSAAPKGLPRLNEIGIDGSV
ncbi:MAG TPA: ABC transporter permease, partial [Candidatus Angelobacter sp.]|nr:ABC transporter permease [Candidatus Angelobacter sp.]